MANRKLDISDLSKELQAVLEDIAREGDRAAALIGAAYVDESLAAMFRKIFVRGKTADSLLDPAGALGNYSVRVRLAYSMGYLSKNERSDLDIIAQIRNRFAHTFAECTFDDPDILRLCQQLKRGMGYDAWARFGSPTPAKTCYAFAAVMLASRLQLCGGVTRRADIADPFQVNRESWKLLQEGHALFLKHEP